MADIPDDLVDRIRLAISDPAVFVKRAESYAEPVPNWSARAVRHVLADWLRFHVLVPDEEYARLVEVRASEPEPAAYMVAAGGSNGRPAVPLAFRPSREAAEAELELRHRSYPSAAVYALHRVDSRGDGA